MSVSEFGLIRRFFSRQRPASPLIEAGIGDDCALLRVPAGHELAVTADTMVENVHFFADVEPSALGHKLLAVNLSDLAAMGAQPLAATLAITLPKADAAWLTAFADGFFALAERFNVTLIGGDTTSGPLTLTVQALGLVAAGRALRRHAARAGDHIYLTGPVGDAGLGLKIRQGYACLNPEPALSRLDKPQPQIEAGLSLVGVAHACIDLSDGLAGDLGHILEQSRVGALIDWDSLPLSAEVSAYIDDTGDWLLPLTAGDDYQLCFTVGPDRISRVPPYCRGIGVIEAEPGLRLKKSGQIQHVRVRGFEHFI